MQTILITGSNGLLGQKLIKQLAHETNTKIVATSSGENRATIPSHILYETLDITSREQVEKCIRKHKPNTIINTAAMTNVDACEDEQKNCWKVNVQAINHFIQALAGTEIHFIHLSTDFIFDGETGPYTENDQPNPLSFYGKSKLAAEKLLTESTINWAILRTVLVYGVAQNISRSNIVLWAKNALEKQQAIKVVNDQYRTPTLAEDLAQGCILAAKKQAKGIYNISGKDFMSIQDMVQRIAKYYQLNASKIEYLSSSTLNQKAKRPPKTGFILDKATAELNYQPHSFEEGLEMVAEQLTANQTP